MSQPSSPLSVYHDILIITTIQHTSGASPSLCIAKGIRQYFQSGELPDADVVCEADMKPLLGSTIMIKEGMTEGEKVLMQAMMNEVQRVRRGPL